MRIDQIMSPREAAVWWKYHGSQPAGDSLYVRSYAPVHNTPQERYRLRKRIPMKAVIRHAHVNNGTITQFESGRLKWATDVSWLRLASFYGIHILSVGVMKKTEWWKMYEARYGELADEPEHRRIRIAAREVALKQYRYIRKQQKAHEKEIPIRPEIWYKQGSLCYGGVY